MPSPESLPASLFHGSVTVGPTLVTRPILHLYIFTYLPSPFCHKETVSRTRRWPSSWPLLCHGVTMAAVGTSQLENQDSENPGNCLPPPAFSEGLVPGGVTLQYTDSPPQQRRKTSGPGSDPGLPFPGCVTLGTQSASLSVASGLVHTAGTTMEPSAWELDWPRGSSSFRRAGGRSAIFSTVSC